MGLALNSQGNILSPRQDDNTSLSWCSLPIPKPLPIGSSQERGGIKMYSKVTCDRASGLPGLVLFLSTVMLERLATASQQPQITCLPLFFPFPYTQGFFVVVVVVHSGHFKLATLPSELLINFPKMKSR